MMEFPRTRIIDLADPVPIRHGLTDDLPFEPQSRPGGPAAVGELFAGGIDVPGLKTSHPQGQEWNDNEGSDHQ